MPQTLSRRAILVGIGPAGVAYSQAGQFHPDKTLFDLWTEMKTIITTWQAPDCDFPDELVVRFEEIKDLILDFRASTVEGLLVKAAVAKEALLDQPKYLNDDIEHMMSVSILRDLLQILASGELA